MEKACQICLQNTPEVYSICACSHKYCLGCCQSHIQACINSFKEIKCLSEGCSSPFITLCIPYQKLSQDLKDKYKKFQRHDYFMRNPMIKNCKEPNCEGQFPLTKKPLMCIACQKQHCDKCLELKHEGQCSQEIAQMMQSLNYKQCKKCHIYVQKIQGCNYISCRCGNQFCYACGIEWVNDPCRLQPFQEINKEIRSNLKGIIMHRANIGQAGCMKRTFVTLYQLFMMPIWIFIGALFIPLISIIGFFCLYILLSPIIIIGLVATAPDMARWAQNLCVILCILLYPLASALLLLLLVSMFVVFLLARDRFQYHHGVFDPIVMGFLEYVNWFLEVFKSIATA